MLIYSQIFPELFGQSIQGQKAYKCIQVSLTYAVCTYMPSIDAVTAEPTTLRTA